MAGIPSPRHPALPPQLVKLLGKYCHAETFYPEGISDALDSTTLAEFAKDLAGAIRNGQLTPETWEAATGIYYTEDPQREMREHLTSVWNSVAPGRPFPKGPEDLYGIVPPAGSSSSNLHRNATQSRGWPHGRGDGNSLRKPR